MPEQKKNWNAILQWLVPLLLVLMGVLSYNLNVRAITAANSYTDRAIIQANYYTETNGKVLEERVTANDKNFVRIEKRLDQIWKKLENLD